MTSTSEKVSDLEAEREENAQKKYVSERGPFEIFANPKMNATFQADAVDVGSAADGFAYEALADEYGEEPVRTKIGEMIQSYAGGVSTTPLFVQQDMKGMSLVRSKLPALSAQSSRVRRLPVLRRGRRDHPGQTQTRPRLRVFCAERHAVQIHGWPRGRRGA